MKICLFSDFDEDLVQLFKRNCVDMVPNCQFVDCKDIAEFYSSSQGCDYIFIDGGMLRESDDWHSRRINLVKHILENSNSCVVICGGLAYRNYERIVSEYPEFKDLNLTYVDSLYGGFNDLESFTIRTINKGVEKLRAERAAEEEY